MPASTPTPEPQEPSEEPSPEATQDPDEVLTADNNEDLAELLVASDAFDTYREFVAKYKGRTIEFDGNIAALSRHGDDTTRFDILIHSGDFDENSAPGPNFQFRDVTIVSDLNLSGDNVSEQLTVGTNVHIVAKVQEYNDSGSLILLDPVATTIR